jgi:glycine betaine/choline ABC-type transport system substrate-binding protein
MPDFYDPVELFWESLLSRHPDQIQAAFNSVDKTTQAQVLEHLQQMVTEEGWHPEQVLSAQTALEILAGE